MGGIQQFSQIRTYRSSRKLVTLPTMHYIPRIVCRKRANLGHVDWMDSNTMFVTF